MAEPRTRGTLLALLDLLRPHWVVLLGSTAFGIIGGLSITALLAIINDTLQADGPATSGALAVFAGWCLTALAGSILSDIGTNYVGQHIIARLRNELSRKILMAPIDQIERFRTYRLIPILTQDVDVISDFAFNFAPLAVSLSVTLGCLTYLAILSWPMFLTMVVAIVIGCAIQYFARGKGIEGFFEARELEDDLQKNYLAIAEGAKELRINRPRRFGILGSRLEGTTERIRDIQIRSINLFNIAKGFGSSLFFIVIGVALAFQSLWPATDKATLSGFILVLLYLKGPLEHLVVELPIFARAQVAFRRIAELSDQFSNPERHLLLRDDGRPGPMMYSIELRNVRYEFIPGEGATPFTLGPINLRVTQGEMIFIVGDNGSGKTTLIKLLLGLYVPQQGALLHNGEPVTTETRDDYRQLFTTVFADYFLFDELVEARQTIPEDATHYLQQLEIAHKVSIVDGRFSTVDLSTGQRKRLALIQAWVERRPVLVFDEWAADQDPTFRRIFYTELLPDLKRSGKTIIVISHDDRYFHVADRVVRLADGLFIEESSPATEATPPDRNRVTSG